MLQAKIIPTTRLRQGTLRLDGSFYCSVGEDTRKLLAQASIPVERVRDVSARIFIGGRARRSYVRSGGIQFLSSSDMLLADFTTVPLVSERQSGLTDLILQYGWTLISRSGTIGKVAFAHEEFVGKAASEHVMRVVPNERIRPGYLYAWLSSPGGVGLVQQDTFGSVIPTIESSFVADLPIPRFDDRTELAIHSLIEQMGAKRVAANQMLRQARTRVYEVTGLSFYEEAPVGRNLAGFRTFVVNHSDLGHRLEARFHDTFVREIQRTIQSNPMCGWIALDQCAELFLPPRGKWINVSDGGLPFLGSGEMFSSRPVASRMVSLKLSPKVQELIVRMNDILVARSGQIYSILGDAVMAGRSLTDKAVTEDAIRIRPNTLITHPGYLFAFLTLSDYGYGQIIRTAYGTSIPHLSIEDMRSILVPLPKRDEQDEIGMLVLQAIQLRDEANEIEDQAQQMLQDALRTVTASPQHVHTGQERA